MTKHKIAVVVAGIDQSYQSNILQGIESAATNCMLDFAVFASFSGTMGNASHDSGEYNIFRLADFSGFDGAILLTNTIDDRDVVNRIHSRIKKAGIPAVSIDEDIPEMYYIGIDNKSAMREMTEHFVKHHGFTKFNYISGPEGNPESIDRLNAFLEVLEENGITMEKDRLYYGDFRAPTGKAAVEYFLANNDSLPEALICANDVMAASAINVLLDRGYKIPEDIAVSGFDNTYNNHNFRIELTSVERPLAYSGELACEILRDHFSGYEPKRSVILNLKPRFTESCGCHDSMIGDLIQYKELNVSNYNKIERISEYQALMNKISCELQDCSTFDEYISTLRTFVIDMDPEEFYFCLCEDWTDERIDERRGREESEIPKRYTENMLVPIAYCQHKFHDDIKMIRRSELIPKLNTNPAPGKFYYTVPLHFGERCLGYMVICNFRFPLHNSMFQSWCITMSNSLENIRKIITLKYAVERLGKLYAQDTFSGINNRNGFVLATKDIFRDCISQNRNIMLMFIDLDGLKTINDTYGHDIGDVAIRSIASVLRDTCKNGEVYCRFGGDEFIIFQADSNEEIASALTNRIEHNIQYLNESMNNPFTLSASMGYIIAQPKEGEDLFQFVTEADKIMYEQKRKKKLSKYLKK
ncbi:MAG: GGDEF domain-containing protein [Ruminococcus sp.]|nr:GGDEF domain-containing protein [Ruminococcus sp.]